MSQLEKDIEAMARKAIRRRDQGRLHSGSFWFVALLIAVVLAYLAYSNDWFEGANVSEWMDI